MSRYETYKPSGIDWIGEIPLQFRLRRFKNDFGYVKGKNPKETFFWDEANGRDTDMPYLSMEYLRNENAEPEFPERDEKLVSVADGESLLLWDGSNAGEFIKSKKGYLSSTMVRIDHSGKILSKYAFYIFQCYERILRDFTNGMGIPHVNGVLLNNTYLPITFDKSEQLAIANYLDDQTQNIDRLIANKKAQAEKLKELRQIEINNAVTKGLNPNAEMKDSGIEWLGKIPKHWEVKRLKNFTTKIGSGVTPKGGSEVYEDAGIPIFRSQNIHFDGLRLDDVAYINEEIHNSMSGSKVEPFDVLLNITGASIGRCFYYDGSLGEANVNQHVCIIRTNKNLNHLFLHWLFSSDSVQSQIFMGQVGTSREGLTFQDIKNIIFALPSLEEQTEIASYLQQRTTAIDQLIKNIEAQIEKLQELRKIKIYEAVTGKIKVNAYAETTA